MAKLTLQEQMLKAGLVNEKKLKKAKKGSKKSRVQAREVKAAVEENKRQQLERDKQLSEQQNAERLNKEIKAQINQLIEMKQDRAKRWRHQIQLHSRYASEITLCRFTYPRAVDQRYFGNRNCW